MPTSASGASSARRHQRRAVERAHGIDKASILKKDARFVGAKPARKALAVATIKLRTLVWGNWRKFAAVMEEDPHQLLQHAKIEDFRRFVDYRLRSGSILKQSTIWTEWKIMLGIYKDETRQAVAPHIREEMHGLLYGHFVDEYNLELLGRAKPVMSVEDLLIMLHHLWAFDKSKYSVERERVNVSTLCLFMVYTSSRPGALVEASCAVGSNECLTYNDVRLFIVPNPEEPARNVIIMKVTLLYTKGNRVTKKPITYLFHEREDNLALCPILHFLSLAFADDAFEADGIRSPEDLYRLKMPVERNSLQLRWKESIRSIPVFRRSVHTKDGIATSPHEPLTYDIFQKSLKKVGKATGFRLPLSSYCFRRGTANAVDGVATDAQRNQVLGHSRSEVFLRHYIDEQVKADVQSAYLGVPAQHTLIKAVGRMSLDRDPRVPQSLTDKQKAEVRSSARLVELANQKTVLREDLIRIHGMIKISKGTEAHSKFMTVTKEYDNLEKTLLAEKLEEAREAFFDAIDSWEIEKQLCSDLGHAPRIEGELFVSLTPVHAFEERNRLAVVLFGELKLEDSDGAASRDRRCCAIRDMAALTFKRESPRHRDTNESKSAALMSVFSTLEDEDEDVENGSFPSACPSTVCLFCLGNENLTFTARTFSFARKDSLTRHVHSCHLGHLDPSLDFECPHPTCEAICCGHAGFKSHAAQVHNVWHGR